MPNQINLFKIINNKTDIKINKCKKIKKTEIIKQKSKILCIILMK